MKIALNLVLTLSDDGECHIFLIRSGIIDLGAFCVELWSVFVSKKNFGPNVIYFVLETDLLWQIRAKVGRVPLWNADLRK